MRPIWGWTVSRGWPSGLVCFRPSGYIQCTYCTVYILYSALDTTPCSVHSTLHSVQCTAHSTVQRAQYSAQCTAHCTVQRAQYSRQCTVHCTLQHAQYSTQYTVHCTLHTAHSSMQSSGRAACSPVSERPTGREHAESESRTVGQSGRTTGGNLLDFWQRLKSSFREIIRFLQNSVLGLW